MTISLSKLTSDLEWGALRATLDPKKNIDAVKNILEQIRASGAVSALIEEEYLDQDFTAAFSAFYSTVFKRHSKLCRRFHFFKEDVTTFINDSKASESTTKLHEAAARSYIGFIVARPLVHAPLGRVVLATPPSPMDMRSEVLVRVVYECHVLGANLCVDGIAMTQQDARVGSCAQAAIWMAGRHFHLKHHGPWFSTVAITDAATKLTDHYVSRSLPAGSDFLTPDNMVRALRAMDREPLVYMADDIKPPTAPNTLWTIQWDRVTPHEVINRYIDSGIPVILGLSPNPGESAGHAVLVTGRTLKKLPPNAVLGAEPSKSTFCEYFLVHDDQRGSNLRLPVRNGAVHAESPYSIEGHLLYLIVPLPKKVFIPAEYAEKISWNLLRKYKADWIAHKARHAGALGTSSTLGDAFLSEFAANRVIARTYLTYGWHYKARMLKNTVGDDFKSVLFYHELPRFVWVTEFGTLSSLNHLEVHDQKIMAHSVIDATAARFWESLSIFHAPGMSVRRYHDTNNPFGDLKDATAPITDDKEYSPKIMQDDQ